MTKLTSSQITRLQQTAWHRFGREENAQKIWEEVLPVLEETYEIAEVNFAARDDVNGVKENLHQMMERLRTELKAQTAEFIR